MADNTKVPVASTGDNIRDLDRGGLGVKTQVVQIDIGGAASESLVSPTNGVPVVGVAGAVAVPVSATALPLPALAATSTLQTPANASLASLDSKLPALGQALAGASVPVVLTAAQVTLIAPGAGAAQDGTDGTGIAQTTGGVGIRGWLSGIYKTLIGVLSTTIADGVTPSQKATVQAFHSGDNQSVGGSGFGLLTGGVAQLINTTGSLDRQREAGTDSIPAVGVSTATAANASPFSVTHAATTAINAATVFTPSAMAGFTAGAPWSIQTGSVLVLEPTPIGGPVPANQEAVVVASVAGATFTAKTLKTHTGAFSVLGFVYNQSRDGTVADGSAGQGFAAGSTYLFNNVLNSGNGGWERERSASGELDGATGVGTAVAAEYEFNSGGPVVLASGFASGQAYDRARNLQGKGMVSAAVTSTTAGSATVVFASAAATNLVQPGQALKLSGGAQTETVYVASTWVPGSSASVTLAGTVFYAAQTTAVYDVFASSGPKIAGFTPAGIGIEEEALYDPVTDLYYIERAATQDNVSGQNIVMENPALWNGTGFDRAKGDTTSGAWVNPKPSLSGGLTPYRNINLLAVGVVVKASAGQLYGYFLTNNAAAVRFVKFYDKATAGVPGTDTPVMTLEIPAGAAANLSLPFGIVFANGIGIIATTLIADNDATGPAANDVVVNLWYK